MRVDIITLFPEMFEGPLQISILGRAQQRDLVRVNVVNLRDFAHDNYRTVDDRPYGGGAGMVLKAEPLFDAIESVLSPDAKVVLLTPQGERLRQKTVQALAAEKHLILICGHYEGVDERVRQALVDQEISIGDYVLTNGNLATLVVLDAVVRLLPGALGCAESAVTESFGEHGLLDFPQYTRPEEYRGMRVPQVLLSGDHGKIEKWRQTQQRVRTMGRRPDLITDRDSGDRQ